MSYNPQDLFKKTQAPTAAPSSAAAPSGAYNPQDLFTKPSTQAPTAAQEGAVGSHGLPLKFPDGQADFSIMGLLGDAFKETVGQAEMAGSLASSVIAEPLAGGAGILSANPDNVGKARDFITYSPLTKAGQDDMADFGQMMGGVGEALLAPSEFLGDATMELTGSPVAAAAMYTLPQALVEGGPMALAGKANLAARTAKQTRQQVVVTEMLQDPELRVNDTMGAQWKLDKDGLAVENTTGKQLVKENVFPAEAALMTNSNKATKMQMKALTEAYNRRAVKDSRGLSPTQIIGSNASRALTTVNKQRQAIGVKMDEFIKGPAGKTPMNIGPVLGKFYKELESIGISPKPNLNTGKVSLDFAGSDLDFQTLGPARTILEDAFQMTIQKGTPTLADVHKMRRGLDNLLDAKKLEQGGALGNMERMILGVRRELNEILKGVDGYGDLNAQYAEIVDGLQAFDAYRPAGTSWDSDVVMNRVGDGLRTASGDTANLNQMLGSLQKLNTAMVRQGVPFDVDVTGLSRFHDFLGGVYSDALGKAADTSTGRRLRNNMQGFALSAAVGNNFGMGNAMAGTLATLADARTAQKVVKAAKERQVTVIKALDE